MSSIKLPPIRLPISILICIVLGSWCYSAWAIESIERTVFQSDWPEYANGSAIGSLPGPQEILKQFNETANDRITIHYPGGEAGEKWARQMQQWFVAFGIPSSFVSLTLGSPGADQLLLQLIKRS